MEPFPKIKIPEDEYVKPASSPEQDRMTSKSLLKLEDGTYVDVYASVYKVGNADRIIGPLALFLGQDRLSEREIRFGRGEHVPLERIVGVCSLERAAGEMNEFGMQIWLGIYSSLGHFFTKLWNDANGKS